MSKSSDGIDCATTEEFSEHAGVAFIGSANSALAAPAPNLRAMRCMQPSDRARRCGPTFALQALVIRTEWGHMQTL